MGPEKPLPISDVFSGPNEFSESLLEFLTTSELLERFCGGIHVLDFFTRSPSLYETAIPQEWREWFHDIQIADILDFLMREDLQKFNGDDDSGGFAWRGRPFPPQSLLDYVGTVRMHLMRRDFNPPQKEVKLSRPVASGMKVKKVHEVQNFAQYVERLTGDIAEYTGQPITHLVDFGSGQNYLGRALASEPYNRDIIAIETRPHNIEGAKTLDVLAKLVERPRTMRNKKLWLLEQRGVQSGKRRNPKTTGGQEKTDDRMPKEDGECTLCEDGRMVSAAPNATPDTPLEAIPADAKGTVQYINHWVVNGSLGPIMPQIGSKSQTPPSLLTISLHSCGNLLHHALRTVTANPEVRAVALIGCCYNLMTERLGKGMTYKHPSLRIPDAVKRMEREASAKDEMGFPMSERMCSYQYSKKKKKHGLDGVDGDLEEEEEGIRLNITARMMAVQAPQNWGPKDSDSFFTRHFYRSVLQRIFLDIGVIDTCRKASARPQSPETPIVRAVSPAGGSDTAGQPIIIGGLRKSCYSNFLSYVRGAQAKMEAMAMSNGVPEEVHPEDGVNPRTGRPIADTSQYPPVPYAKIAAALGLIADEEIEDYHQRYLPRKHELSIAWSLMAYSAGVVESAIVLDRWLWLKEQDEIKEAWVEPVFDYGMSPRNLCIVGVKR